MGEDGSFRSDTGPIEPAKMVYDETVDSLRGEPMRQIELEDELRVRFPARSEDFNEGFEVGAAAAMMAARTPYFTRWLSGRALAQAEALARSLRYRMKVLREDGDRKEVAFQTTAARPALKVVG
jgi:hypothetical protein